MIVVSSLLVDDQERALAFYRDRLGFLPKHDLMRGQQRWLTLTSPGDPDGVELLLEPDTHPAARAWRKARRADGIAATEFGVGNARAEYERLSALGVQFTQAPKMLGPMVVAILDDTCGNLIQLVQYADAPAPTSSQTSVCSH